MASTTNIILVLAVTAIVLPAIAMATDFIVGDENGWRVGPDYLDWVIGKEFVVGDRLVFNYAQGDHNVFKIANATDFKDCTKPPPNEALTSGHDVVTLSEPGTKWYFCGVSDHCVTGGQKFAILVQERASPAPTPNYY